MTTWTRSWQMAIGLGVGGALLFGVGRLTGRLPCYCGCHRTVGHANLLACFVDSHAATCDICQESAQVAV